MANFWIKVAYCKSHALKRKVIFKGENVEFWGENFIFLEKKGISGEGNAIFRREKLYFGAIMSTDM